MMLPLFQVIASYSAKQKLKCLKIRPQKAKETRGKRIAAMSRKLNSISSDYFNFLFPKSNGKKLTLPQLYLSP